MVRSPLLYPPNVTWKTCVLLWRWRKTNIFDQPSSCCWADLPMVSRTTLRTKTSRSLKIEKCLSMSNPANDCVGQMCWSELVACIMLEPTDKKQTFSFCNFTLFGEEKLSFDVPSPLPTTHKESWSVVGSTLSMIVKKYSTIRTKATKNNNDNNYSNDNKNNGVPSSWKESDLKPVPQMINGMLDNLKSVMAMMIVIAL